MEPKDYKELLEQAYTTKNENGELSKLLTRFYDEFEKLHVEKLEHQKSYEDITKANQTLEEMNEKLRGVNMDLFLKVGSPAKNPNHPEPPEKITPITEVYE